MADELRIQAKRMLEEWKIHVFYRRMSVKEYDIRHEALDELFKRIGQKPVRPTGWPRLRRVLREKDPDLKVPEEIRGRAYRGKY